MNIAAVCVTYLRPRQLGHLVRCFERQDYPVDCRELVILDDAGQYGAGGGASDEVRLVQEGPGWRLFSRSRRYATLGNKRNAAALLVSDAAEALAVWDDDDLYLPWALSASAAALKRAAWSRPGVVLHPWPGNVATQHRTGGLFHGGWAYRRDAFERAGGYPARDNGEDQELMRSLLALGVAQADPCTLGFAPFYLYPWGRRDAADWHLSALGRAGYARLGERCAEPAVLGPSEPDWIDLANLNIVPHVMPRLF